MSSPNSSSKKKSPKPPPPHDPSFLKLYYEKEDRKIIKNELVKKIETNILTMPKTITICTEENPQLNEVKFILNYLNISCEVSKLTASVKENKWDGTFTVETNISTLNVSILLVKGLGSFVDYIVYDIPNPTQTSTPILLMESTKTSDAESRNTAINQRFTKFTVAKQRFPNTPLVLFYNTNQVTTTKTNLFGRRLLATYGVQVYDIKGKDLLFDSPPFTTVEEIMHEKNSFKEKKQNVSVKIDKIAPYTYSISAKLSKGENKTLSNDPNKGFITGIASAIFHLDKDAKFIITKHGVAIEKLKKTTEKFWYANAAYDLRLEGCNLSSKGVPYPEKFWCLDTQSEKASTINYQNYMEKNGWVTIYHNHSSSARSYFIDTKGKEHQVPKDITIPDVVMLNKETKSIQICEGKISKDYMLGVKQLDNLNKFINYLEKHYKDYDVQRGLCLYVKTVQELESIKKKNVYPIFFALDSLGVLYTNSS